MRVFNCATVLGTLILLGVQYGDSTLMLTSMLLAAKTGLMLGKMGVGGMMMMLLAGEICILNLCLVECLNPVKFRISSSYPMG
jgi:hypothetical protein